MAAVRFDGVPLIGRSTELEAIRDRVEEAYGGRGGAVLVEGEPGIGKTRLFDEVVDLAGRAGFRVVSGAAHELERDRPFGLLVDTLGVNSRSSDPLVAEVGHLLERVPGPGSVIEGESGPALRYRIIDLLVDAVESMSLAQPLMLALEDLHWADPATLVALRRIVSRAATLSFCVVMTNRPMPRSRELAAVAEAVDGSGGLSMILGPLGDELVGALATELVGAKPGPTLLGACRGAGGNPLYLTELVNGLRRDGLVEFSGGIAEVTRVAMPPGLRLLIVRGLSVLGRDGLELLRMASLLGSVFDVQDLAVVCRRTLAEVVAGLRQALDASVLVEAGEKLAFRHDLVREAVYDDVPLAVRRALHVDAARALVASGAPTAQVAAHFRLGAGPGDEEAIDWLQRAALEVADRDPATAADLLRQAVELLDRNDDRQAEMQANLVALLSWSGRMPEAEEIARDALSLRPSLEVECRLRSNLYNVLQALGRPQDGIENLNSIVNRRGARDVDRAAAIARRARLEVDIGDLAGAAADADEAIRLSQAVDAPYAGAMGSFVRSLLAGFRGEVAEAVEFGKLAVTEEGRFSAGPYSQPEFWMVGHVGLGLAYLQGDRFERSEEAFANALGTFERFGGPNAYVTHHLWGLERYTAGSWDEAVAEFETGLAMAEDIQAVYLSGLARAVMASIAAHRNDLLGAERILAPLDDAPQRLGGPDIYFSLWGRGLLAACRGDDAQAGLLLGNSWAIVAGVDAIAHLNWFAPEHVRLQLRVGNVTEAGAAALVLEGAAARVPDVPSIRGMALRCRGLVEGDVDLLLAAVASYRDSPRPIERAWACEDAGAALVRAGRHQEGIDLLEEAREGLQSVDALRDIRRIDAALRAAGVRRGSRAERRRVRHGPGSLTETERKVIGLIEDGRTNRQIAEQLFISPRTVDTHVAHILAKLGVRSRREAVGLMRTAG